MSRSFFALVCLMIMLPGTARASQIHATAGFAPGSLWLSKTSATAGEIVRIYTVVYDSSDSAIEGDVVFDVDAKESDAQHFKLAAGETQVISSSWTAVAGTHAFGASIKNISGVSAISSAETNPVTIQVTQATASPLARYVNVASRIVSSSSPAVRNAAQAVFGATEALRHAGSDLLLKALSADGPTSAASSTKRGGHVLGASASGAPAENASILGSVWHSILRALQLVFNIQALFYIALLAVLFIVYKIVRALFSERRP